jgi:hypothetical protein
MRRKVPDAYGTTISTRHFRCSKATMGFGITSVSSVILAAAMKLVFS